VSVPAPSEEAPGLRPGASRPAVIAGLLGPIGALAGATSGRPGPPTDLTRRQLLRRSDALIDHIEQLRLRGRTRVPAALRRALAALANDVYTGARPPQVPATAAAAHRFVLALQSRLLRSSVRGRRRLVAAGVGGRSAVTWLELELPAGERDAAWRELADLTVERALDRWRLVRDRAATAARRHHTRDARRLWCQQQAAWANYWRLAEQLRDERP
jgi:hypothetical protein